MTQTVPILLLLTNLRVLAHYWGTRRCTVQDPVPLLLWSTMVIICEFLTTPKVGLSPPLAILLYLTNF